MERTLILLKPDTVQRGIIGEVITRFEKVGLKVVGMKMLKPTRDQYYKHYEEIGKMISRLSEQIFERNLKTMQAGPVIAMVLEGHGAIELVRKMVGPTEPKSAAPGTIRGDFAHMSYARGDELDLGIPNIVHASGDQADAELEVYHWFNDNEMFSYKTVNEKFVSGTDKSKPSK